MTHQIMINLAKLATNKNEKGKKISDSELKSIIKDILKLNKNLKKIYLWILSMNYQSSL